MKGVSPFILPGSGTNIPQITTLMRRGGLAKMYEQRFLPSHDLPRLCFKLASAITVSLNSSIWKELDVVSVVRAAAVMRPDSAFRSWNLRQRPSPDASGRSRTPTLGNVSNFARLQAFKEGYFDMEFKLKCNNRIDGDCRRELQKEAFVTTCTHAFCAGCVEKHDFADCAGGN